MKVTPNLHASFISESGKTTQTGVDEQPGPTEFHLMGGVNVNASYKHEKIAIYTGIGLNLFDLVSYGYAGGKNKNKDTEWAFRGILWNNATIAPAAANSGFGNVTNAGGIVGNVGLTFTPIEGLVFGVTVNTFFNNLNLRTMSWTPPPGTNAIGIPILANVTVSYQFK